MDIITQTLFSTLLDFCLTHWRLETMTIIIFFLVMWLVYKYYRKLTIIEISLSVLCLFLFCFNAYFIDVIVTQQLLIQKQKATINLYRTNIEKISKNLDNEIIKMDFRVQIKELERKLEAEKFLRDFIKR